MNTLLEDTKLEQHEISKEMKKSYIDYRFTEEFFTV